MATIFTVFPVERRGMAMGVFGLGVVFAPPSPDLGGLMIEYSPALRLLHLAAVLA